MRSLKNNKFLSTAEDREDDLPTRKKKRPATEKNWKSIVIWRCGPNKEVLGTELDHYIGIN